MTGDTRTILDGGMGAELLRRSGNRTPLWSAQALIDDPDLVVRTHLDYITAGARMIITNSYSTVPSYLETLGLEHEFTRLAGLAGELARRAVDQSGEDVRIAGSVPPLSESYRPDLVPPDDIAGPIYTALTLALEPHVDLFICETMSSAREALNAATAAKRSAAKRDLPVYVSWTLHEEPGMGLRSGETVTEAFAKIRDLDLDGYLFNCTSAEAIDAGLKALRHLTDKPTGGYPNRYRVPEGWVLGQEVATNEDSSTERFVAAALKAFDDGAAIYGGCCTVGPEDISALTQALESPPSG